MKTKLTLEFDTIEEMADFIDNHNKCEDYVQKLIAINTKLRGILANNRMESKLHCEIEEARVFSII